MTGSGNTIEPLSIATETSAEKKIEFKLLTTTLRVFGALSNNYYRVLFLEKYFETKSSLFRNVSQDPKYVSDVATTSC